MATRPSTKKSRAAKRNAKLSAEAQREAERGAQRGRRIGLLYGLTGLFGIVVAGLVLARPRPLQAQSNDAPEVVLLATGAPGAVDPLDAALQTGDGVKAGKWTGVSVLRLTTTQAKAAHAHFKVMLDGIAGQGAEIIVGSEWLQQSPVPSDPKGEFVLVVVVDDHEREVKNEKTVVALVDRLCERLKVDQKTVRWS